jgi:iron complex transport system substrate-binding protein
MRIVSLLPGATEIVYALGLGADLVGVSHECDYPPDASRKPKLIEPIFDSLKMGSKEIDGKVLESIGKGQSIYRIKFDELKAANPDLIITQDLCDVCAVGATDVLEAVNRLGKPVEVISLNPHTLRDIEDDVRSVAKAVGTPDRGEKVVAELEAKADAVRRLTGRARRWRVFCVEWLNPIMNAGHWVSESVKCAGGVDGLAVDAGRSTCVEWSRVVDYDPEIIILMPCGFNTERTTREATQFFTLPNVRELTALCEGRVYATDGHSYFSRSGPRVFDGIEILARLIHPELFSDAINPRLGVRVKV